MQSQKSANDRSLRREARKLSRAGTAPRPGLGQAALQVFVFRLEAFVGTEVFDSRRPVMVGRHARADLRLDGDTISRRHCRIVLEDDVVLVEDLGSGNGTFVNRNPSRGRVSVHPSDAIRVGPFILKVRALQPMSPRALDTNLVDATTRIEGILVAERTNGTAEVPFDAPRNIDPRLYDAALRRTRFRAAHAGPPNAEITAQDSTGASMQETAAAQAAIASSTNVTSRSRAASSKLGSPIDVGEAARLRDLDALIAALDARERAENAPAHALGEPVFSKTTPATYHEEKRAPEREDSLCNEVWSQASESKPRIGGTPPRVRPGGKTPRPKADESPVLALKHKSIEISARAGGRVVDETVLCEPGEQYILGHVTPRGKLAPAKAHVGLRLVRINPDRSVDLVFPKDVRGQLVRGDVTVRLEELTEGRKYSCLRLEPRDVVRIVLGEGKNQMAYHARFSTGAEDARSDSSGVQFASRGPTRLVSHPGQDLGFEPFRGRIENA